MRRFPTAVLAVLCGSAVVAAMAGCGDGFVNIASDASTGSTSSASTKSMGVSVYGGHAPLVGAHVYLVQPGTTGYGSPVTSIFTNTTNAANTVYCTGAFPCMNQGQTGPNPQTGGETFPLVANGSWTNSGNGTDEFVPSGIYGGTTDAFGQFYFTGDYTCQVGRPVILVAYGGAPSYIGSGNGSAGSGGTNTQSNPVSLSSVVVSNVAGVGNGTGTATYTFNVASGSQELYYVGEPVTFSGLPTATQNGAVFGLSFFNGASLTVVAAGLGYTSFQTSYTLDNGQSQTGYTTAAFPAGTYTATGGVATGTPLSGTTSPANFNPSIVNMAVLGNCPGSGNFSSPSTTVSVTASSSTATTATFTATNTFSAGQQVTLTGFSGGGAGFNTTATITAATPAQFQIAFATAVGTGGTGSATVAGAPINFLYMNEVSTAVTAYAFAGFTNTAASALTGYDEFHIGAPNTAQAQTALANASITAANLYDIQGSAISTSFAGEGHIARITTPSLTGSVPVATIDTIGNILAACVDSNNTYRADNGSGTQSSACKVLGQYAQDNGVLDTSVLTHQAANIAQAAFSMARFPQGAGTGTTSGGIQTVTAPTPATAAAFVGALYALPTGNVPFTPNLTTAGNSTGGGTTGTGGTTVGGTGVPNDFSVPIRWSDVSACPSAATNRCSESGFDIDAQGNVWAAAQYYSATPLGTNTGAAIVLSPAGTFTIYTPPTGGMVNGTSYAATGAQPGLELDPSGNAYAPGLTGAYKFTPGTFTGTQINASNGAAGGSMAVDGNNIYFAGNELNPNNSTASLIKETFAGVQSAPFPIPAMKTGGTTAGDCLNVLGFVTVDQVGNIWTGGDDQTGVSDGNAVCEFNSAGQLLYRYFPYLTTSPAAPYSNFFQPWTLVTDRLNNVFFSDGNNQYVAKVNAGQGTASAPVLNAGYAFLKNSTTSQTPAATDHFSKPSGVALDGAHTIWVTNQVNDTVAHLDDSLNALSGTFYGFPFSYTDPRNGSNRFVTDEKFVAVDAGGNVWTGGSNDGQFQEFVGMGTPTVTPRSYARANGLIGAKPGLIAAQITAYNIGNAGANNVQFTIAGTNIFTVGETVVLSGFPISTFFNGQTVVVIGVGFGNTVFQVTFPHTNVSPTTENGIASAVN